MGLSAELALLARRGGRPSVTGFLKPVERAIRRCPLHVQRGSSRLPHSPLARGLYLEALAHSCLSREPGALPDPVSLATASSCVQKARGDSHPAACFVKVSTALLRCTCAQGLRVIPAAAVGGGPGSVREWVCPGGPRLRCGGPEGPWQSGVEQLRILGLERRGLWGRDNSVPYLRLTASLECLQRNFF